MMAAPRWFYACAARVRAILGRRHADAELDDELAYHLELETRENIRRGMTQEEAARRARIALGGVVQTAESTREGRPLRGLEVLVQDVRYALRLIRRAPGFATVAILTIALGIGANTAIFSVVNGILLRPLPFADPDRLVRVYLHNPSQSVGDGFLSVPDVDDWRSRARAFSSIAGYQALPIILTGRGEPTEIQAAFMVGDLFRLLGGSPLLGRALREDDVRDKTPNLVISERLWRSRFSSDAAVLGTTVELGAHRFTVVGVMPSTFRFPAADTDAWGPHSIFTDQEVGPRVRPQRGLEGVARLAPGVSVEQANADVNSVAAQLASEFPATNKGWTGARVVPLRTAIVGDVDTPLVVVLAVVGVILLIACANLANLLLARGTARLHEIATRVALGAGRRRIVRQLLTESAVLAIIGGVAGMTVAVWGVRTLLALSADTLPRVDDVRIDGRVIGFGFALTLVTALLFGLLPSCRAASAAPHQRLRSRRAAGSGRRIRSGLVVAEVALTVVLVVGAVLMARSFLQLRAVNPGFDRSRMLAITLQYNLSGVSGDLGVHLAQRREQIGRRIAALPGVVDAGSITKLPLEGECRDTLIFRREGVPAVGPALRAENCLVSRGYLRTMGIPLRRGETLPDRLTPGAPVPFLISEAAAKKFWPGEDAIGTIVRSNYAARGIVVGIVGDVRQHGLAHDPPAVVYFDQRIAPRASTTIVLRAAGDPLLLTGPVRQVIQEIDPNQPIRSMATLDEIMAESIARDRFFTLLFGVFGTLALLLAAVGVYGVLAYSVEQRTSEIGVRIALGAQTRDLLRMVVGGGMALVVAGIATGTVASLLLTRVLQSQLHGISAKDPVTFAIAPAVLIVVALLACYMPARRAMRVEAVTALRAE